MREVAGTRIVQQPIRGPCVGIGYAPTTGGPSLRTGRGPLTVGLQPSPGERELLPAGGLLPYTRAGSRPRVPARTR